MSPCDKPNAMSVTEAIETVLGTVETVSECPPVATHLALNRVLSEDIYAPVAVPGADNSAMDGYAFAAEHWQKGQSLRIVGEVFAGHPVTQAIRAGECVRIMTGGILPPGCDTVVMQEQATASEDQLDINITPNQGDHVRCKGEDLRQGSIVLKAGTRLTASHIALLSSLGITQVALYRPIIVGVMSTGDELVEPGRPLEAGQIYESNRYGLIAMLQKLGADIVDLGIVPDNPNDLTRTLCFANRKCDWVLSSGGVSVGNADYVKPVLEELGCINFWKVAIKPGKPFAFGHLPNSIFAGLPGNPVSSFVTFLHLVVPGLRKLAGEAQWESVPLQAEVDDQIRRQPGREEYQRGRYFNDAGKLKVVAHNKQGSGIMSSFVNANCFIRIPAEQGALAPGEMAEVIPFDYLLS